MANVTKKKNTSGKRITKKQVAADRTRWNDSYIWLLLGIIVVAAAAIVFTVFLQIRQTQKTISLRQEVSSTHITALPSLTPGNPPADETIKDNPYDSPQEIIPSQKGLYVVKANDNLWTIAETQLGNGYRWKEIAVLNKLENNPGIIYRGMRLQLPQRTIETITPAVAPTKISQSPAAAPVVNKTQQPSVTQPITGNTYVIRSGDTLSSIAERAYGDSYRYPEIAQANNLSDPRLIHAGNVLKIPR